MFVWGGALLEGKDELVAGTVEAAHTAIVLSPDDEVLQFIEYRAARILDLAHVTPVHTGKVDGSINGNIRHVCKDCRKKGGELVVTHLARRHGELAMLDLSHPRDMAIDGNVVGRVGEHHPRLAAPHEDGDIVRIERIAAEQTVGAKLPQIARLAALRNTGQRRLHIVSRIAILFRCDAFDQAVHLGDGEAGDIDIEIEVISLHQSAELGRQHVLIPAGIERQLIVSQYVGALLSSAHVGELDAGHLGHTEQFGAFHPAMTD